jgi:ubiquinone/menaquinone biosynthesis C-methylase UbiE
MNYIKANWDALYVGKGLQRFLPQRFAYGALTAWERDLFMILSQLLPEKGSLLSVGCGRALIDYWLGQVWGAEIHLLDLSLPLLKKVHRSFRNVPHRIYQHDALELPFENRRFDIVWNAGVWEHFFDEQIHRGIAEMARVSKGYVVVSVPYAKSRPYLIAKEWLEKNGLWVYGYENPKETLRPYFEAAKLKFIEEHPIGSSQTCRNYVNMIPDHDARDAIMKQLTPEDFLVYPHLVAIGQVGGPY